MKADFHAFLFSAPNAVPDTDGAPPEMMEQYLLNKWGVISEAGEVGKGQHAATFKSLEFILRVEVVGPESGVRGIEGF